MVQMNQKMKEYLCKCKSLPSGELSNVCDEIMSKLTLLNDCVIYDERGEVNKIKINTNQLYRENVDRTEYEVGCNEIELPNQVFNAENIYPFLCKIKRALQLKFPKRKFCLIVVRRERGVLRLHTYREEDGLWISTNLEGYEEPILYEVT